METVHADGTPLAAYLEGTGRGLPTAAVPGLTSAKGQGSFEPEEEQTHREDHPFAITSNQFAPSSRYGADARLHNAWSVAINSRLGSADNARFLEHFRYTIVASQLLNEYLDHGALHPGLGSNPLQLDGAEDQLRVTSLTTSLYGAALTAVLAFALVCVLSWATSERSGSVSKGRIALALITFALAALLGYAYVRRQWLKSIRLQAVTAVSELTASWQGFEASTSSALSLIQEVELVSKGYKLGTPLPPASRIEENGTSRRCGRLRKALHNAYTTAIPTCVKACTTLRRLSDEDDFEKFLEVYDVNPQDAKQASGDDPLLPLEDDAESLKSLRVMSYRAGILRRIVLCALMALEADGGKPDFARWRVATETMRALSANLGGPAEKLRLIMTEMESLTIPATPLTPPKSGGHGQARQRMRGQVRKISMLSSGIRALQAKMHILREETNRSIEQQEDLTDLGPSLMAQYESIGTDLKELMQAWEAGKASLQTNLTKQEHRISMASSSAASGIRSPVSSFGGSLGGLTAVEEGSTPAEALKALNGETFCDRSSMATTPSDEEQVFEAVAMPRQRSTLSREERIAKMQEERERQATVRAKRDSNTNMLRELESVINLRPRAKTGSARITSL
ncbi:hypothetical protein BAUCODRAFT_73056 [Baudoinia panamericana UAMH 10762]|uniref:Vezatin n=1 Tax=Baudoinia panamericana (strain UAMH 10762) TaxID=717646 RepID=M2MED8_BAUPA|nr:uncharacterized protein BAUCODRAFT_73056 [Baudoinia panamericana UAMH 10762]EMC94941.1 hypothetical protein BAUCODRAFT_73056 [Baudoinia panamericana UAMH 10762]